MSKLNRERAPAAGTVRPFHFPAIHREPLENGLTVVSARHRDLPLVTAQVMVDAGAAGEPRGLAGLASLTAATLETGAGDRTGEALAWEFERLGVELHTSTTWDALLLRATAPTERIEPTLALLAQVARAPSFPENEVQRLRGEQAADILQRRKEPRALANDMVGRFLYAPGVPYAHPLSGSLETVNSLDRPAIVEYHRRRFGPSASTVFLVGDVDQPDAQRLVQAHFGDWVGDAVAAVDFAITPATDTREVHIVDRPGAVQSEIRLAQSGVDRHHADYFALEVMNSLLGGAFTSRLNLNLRERQGFTYGIRSQFVYRRRPGPFLIQTAVATDVTAPAVGEILNEVDGLQRDGATPDEVAAARDYLGGILPLELQTTEQLANRLKDLTIFSLPDDYFQHYRAGIMAVTPPDVIRVARQHLQPDRMVVIVVGDAAAIRNDLEAMDIGAVQVHPEDGGDS